MVVFRHAIGFFILTLCQDFAKCIVKIGQGHGKPQARYGGSLTFYAEELRQVMDLQRFKRPKQIAMLVLHFIVGKALHIHHH